MITKENIRTFNELNRILIKEEGFIYLLPHPALINWISNYTITFPSDSMISNKYTVIPHGSATLVFSYDGNRIFSNLFGPATKLTCVGNDANRFQLLFIVEFQPAGYYAFSKIPQKELTDCVIPFETVHPTMNRLMAQQLEKALDVHSLITEMDRLIMAHLLTSPYRDEFSLANHIIVNSGGQISVKELSQNIFYSERHLGRLFGEYMGMNIKSFSRLVRVNKAIRCLRDPHNSITQAYLQTGFYDTPHFIHDFKSICQITPQEYRDNMSDFYSEIAKF